MSAISDQDLHSLLTPPTGDGQFLSCYAALDTPDANQAWEREFESRASDLHRSIHANDAARADLDLNLLAVRRVLSADVPRHYTLGRRVQLCPSGFPSCGAAGLSRRR